ncbi:MAG: hypothetical protein P8Z37_20000, partial [Acidobacteriota bacterium]
EHAATIAQDGFSKERIKDFLFRYARYSWTNLSEENLQYRQKSPEKFGEFTNGESAPIARRGDFVVMVLGGPGKQSCFIPTFGNYSVTQLIDV